MRKSFFLFRLFCCLVLGLIPLGCGGDKFLLWPDFMSQDQEEVGPSELVENDPGGPIPQPVIPQELLEAADRAEKNEQEAGRLQAGNAQEVWSYTLEVISRDAPELVEPFTRASLLKKLEDQPPSTLTGLNQRIKSDLDESRSVLNAFGYYSGSAWSRIIPREEPGKNRAGTSPEAQKAAAHHYVTVRITFRPGEQYKIGRSSITITDAAKYAAPARVDMENNAVAEMNIPLNEELPQPQPELSASGSTERGSGGDGVAAAPGSPPGGPGGLGAREPRPEQQPKKLTSLADVGLADGAPAVADSVLKAVDRVEETLHDNGYPFAKVADTRFVVDHDSKTLEADVKVEAGPICYMGALVVTGESRVTYDYLDAMRNWRTGRLWRQSRVDNFTNAIRQTGLFQLAEAKPSDTADEKGLRQVVLKVSPAPERTVSGALKYNSDFGAGVQASWHHRNLTGRGDKLNLDLPIWQDMQILSAQYRLPFFMDNRQYLIAQAALRNEDVDAYKLSSLSSAIGIERRFSRRFSGSARVSAEAGKLETPEEPERDFYMFGLPLNAIYNGSNSLLDPTRGFRLNLLAGPYIGYYNDYFTALRARLDATAYLPVVGEDKLVLAFRASGGSVIGADSDNIPTTIRFYSGGGGSVRGYAYQSLGPRNKHDDPLGGASMLEFSGETRWRAGENWGLVAFLDGGMVYPEYSPEFNEELRWGAGLGFRYYTVIGPVRVDLATPLNPRDDDDSFQLYISIGQSF